MDEVRPSAKRFEDLLVWQKSHALVLQTYKMTACFPSDERFGLVSQMRRAAVSVPANIAEGFRRATAQEKRRFMNIAQASLEELRYFFILTEDLAYADTDGQATVADEVGRMLAAYLRKI
ncbi:four helix bundle protein [Phycisphaeraceae bacterium D3-23]